MPLDTGIAVTKFLILSLPASISNGCRNTYLLQLPAAQALGCNVAAECQATPPRSVSRRDHRAPGLIHRIGVDVPEGPVPRRKTRNGPMGTSKYQAESAGGEARAPWSRSSRSAAECCRPECQGSEREADHDREVGPDVADDAPEPVGAGGGHRRHRVHGIRKRQNVRDSLQCRRHQLAWEE